MSPPHPAVEFALHPPLPSVSDWGHNCMIGDAIRCTPLPQPGSCTPRKGLPCPPTPLAQFDRELRFEEGDELVVGAGGTCVVRPSGGFECNAFQDSFSSFAALNIQPRNDIVRAAAGFASVCAVSRSGTLDCWTKSRHSADPARAPALGIEDAVDVALGFDGGLVLRRDGTLWAFGGTHHGHRGQGGWHYDAVSVPIEVPQLGPGAVVPTRE